MDSNSALGHIDEIITSGQKDLCARVELPEMDFRFDISRLQHDEALLFKSLHQSCMVHAAIFRRANQVKLVYQLAGFRSMTHQKNPIGIYAMARSLLEFAAFTSEVRRKLSSIQSDAQKLWSDRGQEFFTTIVRARFGTSNPEKKKVLLDHGVKPDDAKPFHILTCIQKTAKRLESNWLESHYDFLCDFVHHNLSSQTIAAAQSNVSNVASSAQGGMLITPQPGLNVVYAYPADNQAKYAIDQTAVRAAMCADLVLNALNTLPESPYSNAEILAKTGHPLGVGQFNRAIGENDPCYCGSGMKYGRCCGKRSN
jgi:hypothetical protein